MKSSIGWPCSMAAAMVKILKVDPGCWPVVPEYLRSTELLM